MSDLTGLHVLVLGAGKSGCAAARLARSRGAAVTLVDAAPKEHFEPSFREGLARDGIDLQCGCTGGAWTGPEISRVVVSPGIALESPLHRLGESTGAPLVGELEFGASYLECPFLAVTGTNGKTTTTELLTACLKAAGFAALAAGNIGLPLSQVALDAPKLDYLVVEVSSFQLEHARSFRPTAAILLNVTPDHLNRHGSLEEYRSVKARLLEQLAPGGYAIYHAALEPYLHLSETVGRSRLWLRGEEPRRETPSENAAVRPVGTDWQVAADGLRRLDGEQPAESPALLLPRASLQLVGSHNLADALAVVATLSALGIPLEKYRAALCGFHSGPHRTQLVAVRKGVQYVDDSKATDVDAMIQALRTIGPSVGKSIHLIAGGLDKGCSLEEAKCEIRMYVKRVCLIGACRERLAEAWGDAVPCEVCDSLEKAVLSSSAVATSGDVVLLSPGCASMDMFRSYEERGERFSAAAVQLPDDGSPAHA